MAYWLMKSEPEVFGYDDLVVAKREGWDGIRNYEARNFLRAMRKGDEVRVSTPVMMASCMSETKPRAGISAHGATLPNGRAPCHSSMSGCFGQASCGGGVRFLAITAPTP